MTRKGSFTQASKHLQGRGLFKQPYEMLWVTCDGCDENSDLENSDFRPEKLRPSGCLENSDPKNSDSLGVSNSDPKTQTLWVSRKLRSEKLRPSGCLENSDPKNSDPLGVSKTQTHWVSRKVRPSVYVPLCFDRYLTF